MLYEVQRDSHLKQWAILLLYFFVTFVIIVIRHQQVLSQSKDCISLFIFCDFVWLVSEDLEVESFMLLSVLWNGDSNLREEPYWNNEVATRNKNRSSSVPWNC